MSDLLAVVLNVSVLVFAVSSMLGAGLRSRLQTLVQPLRDPGAVFRVVVANFVLVPLLAIVLLRLLRPPEPYAIGLFLVAAAAGAPFLIKLAVMAEASIRLSTTALVLLLPLTIVYMPLVVPFAEPEAEVSMWAIARPLLVTMLIPLAAGMIIRAYRPTWTPLLTPLLERISTIALLVLLASTVLANLSGIARAFRTSAVVAAVLLVAGAFVIGFVVGGPGIRKREALGLATGQRNISAATVVATQSLGDPNVVTMVVVTALVGFAVLFPAAWILRRSWPAEPDLPGGRGPRRA